MYTVTYQNEIEKIIKKELCTEKEHEVAILAMAGKSGESICIDTVVTVLKEGQTDVFAYIEPEKQLKLIKYCEIKKKMPVIIHTHLYAEKQVAFSPIDWKFIMAFQEVQKKMKCEQNSLFLVYGANQVALELMLNGKAERSTITDTINFKGDLQ